MNRQESYRIPLLIRHNNFDAAHMALDSYINYPADPAGKEQTAINARKKEMLALVTKGSGLPIDHPTLDKIKALLTGGNRHSKRTKRTTNRKMRKSLIRRR